MGTFSGSLIYHVLEEAGIEDIWVAFDEGGKTSTAEKKKGF